MTSNEIAYRQLLREARRDREAERHNRATEGLESTKQTETQRANLAQESIGRDRNQTSRDVALFNAGASLGGAGIGLLAKGLANKQMSRAARAAANTAEARATLDALLKAGSTTAAAKTAATSTAAKAGSAAVKAAPVAAAFVPLAASIAYAKHEADQKTPEEAALEYELINEQAKASKDPRRDKTTRVRNARNQIAGRSEDPKSGKESYDPRKRK